jgi:hypothetical protein
MDVRVNSVERSNKYMRTAIVLRTLGWLSIIWGLMVSMWIWMGEKAGSNLWLWWTLGQFAAGAVLLFLAARMQARATTLIAASGEIPRIKSDRAA